MEDLVKEFNDYRSRMNEVILGQKNLTLNRFFNLDAWTGCLYGAAL